MILIFSFADDPHALCVEKELARRGAAVRIVDTRRLDPATLSFDPIGGGRLVDGDERTNLDEATCIWARRLPPPARLDVQPRVSGVDRYMRREWSALVFGALCSADAALINDLVAQERAEKPLQLKLASEAGLDVPLTLITNSPSEAERFVAMHDGKVVHKSMTAPEERFLATKRWEAADADALDLLRHAPCVFQREIVATREIRCTVVGETMISAEFRPMPGTADARAALGPEAQWAPHTLPREIEAGISRLMSRLGLVVSTIDLRLTDEGAYYFLDLNPQGQFLYVEILTGLPIVSAFADLLLQSGRRA